jgi:hypothetical protein
MRTKQINIDKKKARAESIDKITISHIKILFESDDNSIIDMLRTELVNKTRPEQIELIEGLAALYIENTCLDYEKLRLFFFEISQNKTVEKEVRDAACAAQRRIRHFQ